MTSILAGGVTFSNVGAVDANGVSWAFSKVAGWFDGAQTKTMKTDRPWAQGEFPVRTFRGARVITITGTVHAPTRGLAAAAQMTLTSILADGTYADVVVSDPDQGTLSASVRLEGEPMVDWHHPLDIDYQIAFYAPDPLRYGDPVSVATTFPTLRGGLSYDLYTDGAGADLGYLDYGAASDTGRIVVTNTGTAAAPVTCQVAGEVDASGFDIAQTGTDLRLRFVGPVSPGSSLVLDGSTGNVLIDGTADRAGQLTYRDWPVIPPGGSLELAFIPLGVNLGAQLTAVVRPGSW